MCGRFTLHQSAKDVAARFGVDVPDDLQPRFNIAPMQQVAAIVQEDEPRFQRLKWGLVPFWAKEASIGNRMINARAETLAEKPAYRRAIAKRRCLIPADGFYEWQRDGNVRTPMHIVRRDRGLFAFAGIWETWRAPDESELRTCSIITVEPNALLSTIHNRMPAILQASVERTWLAPDTKVADALSLLVPYADDDFEAHAVSRRVNSPMTDDALCIEPVEANG
ncbi:MAG TPA: SOS response-associated peptidase [Blastocatellia bacterium]|nr:SOS response-associated peptidase [Blastocatellia bacterium]